MRDKITELQNMLRYIETCEYGDSAVYLSGVYDGATKDAVILFQSNNRLTPNGIVDEATWNAVVREYSDALLRCEAPLPVSFFPPTEGYCLATGDGGEVVRVLQIMLNELRRCYDGYSTVDVDGRYGRRTEDAVRTVQRASLLPVNGRVDKATWNCIASEYNYLETKRYE